MLTITAGEDLESLGYITYPDPEPVSLRVPVFGPQPAPVVALGEVVTVTGVAERGTRDVDDQYRRLQGRYWVEVHAFERKPVKCIFVGWSYIAEGLHIPEQAPSSNWTGDDEGSPAWLSESRRVRVAVVRPVDPNQPKRYRKPFRCLPEHISKEREQ